jgi:hypothetical protein
MPKKELGVVKSEQDKGLVKAMMMVMMMIFCVYSFATWCTSYEVIRTSCLLTHATSPFLLKYSFYKIACKFVPVLLHNMTLSYVIRDYNGVQISLRVRRNH